MERENIFKDFNKEAQDKFIKNSIALGLIDEKKWVSVVQAKLEEELYEQLANMPGKIIIEQEVVNKEK